MKELKPITLFENYDDRIRYAISYYERNGGHGELATDYNLEALIKRGLNFRKTEEELYGSLEEAGTEYFGFDTDDHTGLPTMGMIFHTTEHYMKGVMSSSHWNNIEDYNIWMEHARRYLETGKPQFYIYDDTNYIQTDEAYVIEDGLYLLFDELISFDDCTEKTRTQLIKWCTVNDIELGFSDDVRDIASVALKGNHKLK